MPARPGQTIGYRVEVSERDDPIRGFDGNSIGVQAGYCIESLRERQLDLFFLELNKGARRVKTLRPDRFLLWRKPAEAIIAGITLMIFTSREVGSASGYEQRSTFFLFHCFFF